MEGRHRSPDEMVRAAKLVAGRGRAYRKRKANQVTVFVFTKSLTECDLLEGCFGGNHFKHGSGRYWYLGKQTDLCRMFVEVRPYLPEKHGLRTLIDFMPLECLVDPL